MKSDDQDLIQNEEYKDEAYDTNRGGEAEGALMSNNRTGDMQGLALLAEPGRVTSSGVKGKDIQSKVTVHTDKNFRIIEDAQKNKEIEMRKARDEEKKEVEALLNLPQ